MPPLPSAKGAQKAASIANRKGSSGKKRKLAVSDAVPFAADSMEAPALLADTDAVPFVADTMEGTALASEISDLYAVNRAKPPSRYLMGTVNGQTMATYIVGVSAKQHQGYIKICDKIKRNIEKDGLTKTEATELRDELIKRP